MVRGRSAIDLLALVPTQVQVKYTIFAGGGKRTKQEMARGQTALAAIYDLSARSRQGTTETKEYAHCKYPQTIQFASLMGKPKINACLIATNHKSLSSN